MFGLFKAKYSVPHQSDLAKIEEWAQYTPDLPFLEKKKAHLVFLYDNLMRLHEGTHFKDQSEYKCVAFTHNRFSVLKKCLGKESFPVAINKPITGIKAAAIRGEIHLVPTENMVSLDTLYENTVQFIRIKAPLIIPYRKITTVQGINSVEPKTKEIPAWIYVGVPSYWHGLVDSAWRSRTTAKIIGDGLYMPMKASAPRPMWLKEYIFFGKSELTNF